MIKIFTHTDLDGVSCGILGELAFVNVDIEYCNYNNINDKISNYLLSEEKEKYDITFITDISVNEKVAEMINMSYKHFVLLDHHATALWLNKYSWVKVIIKKQDKINKNIYKTSGAYLFYKWLIINNVCSKEISTLNEKENLEKYIEMVRLYDTWEWKDVSNIPKLWNDLFYILGREEYIENVIKKIHSELEFTETDKLLLDLEQDKIIKYIKGKNEELITKDILGYKTGIVFGEQYVSELGNTLCEMNPNLDFIIIINMAKAISYRSVKDKIDLGKFAIAYGGGGHKSAAGSPITNNLKMEVINLLFNE